MTGHRKEKMDNDFVSSSDNVYHDAGHPNPDAMLAKAETVMLLDHTIKTQHLSHKDAAARMGISAGRLSKIVRGHFEEFTVEELRGFIEKIRGKE